MPLKRRRSHYQQLTEFERGRVVGVQEGGFSFRDIAERLGRTVNDCGSSGQGKILPQERPGERLQPTCLRPRHTGPTPGVMVWEAISYNSRNTLVVIPRTLTANLYVSLVIQPVILPFMNSIQGGVFQQNNARPHTAVVTQHALQSADMLPWPARSPDLSPIEHVWDIIGRQLQRHPQPALTVPVLTDQVQQAWNSIPQTDIRYL
ncbi:hypothetical protein AVEN_84136-1 [Araneus ventricosus]|uniref:Tc1-like transposase DDE domain-containing protein n=1 Tax=Araneus ventricosus TaxID=182803 RepID=A0A4Y2DA83_ARAVE|nr:hypothetical protein AVEN_84136-1 [Araneus ventricosus]